MNSTKKRVWVTLAIFSGPAFLIFPLLNYGSYAIAHGSVIAALFLLITSIFYMVFLFFNATILGLHIFKKVKLNKLWVKMTFGVLTVQLIEAAIFIATG